MWRTNALRVRKCSSAAAWRTCRRYSSQSLPITIPEFEAALNGIFGRETTVTKCPSYNTRTLGFAVSGGVDSMALASLFARSRDLSNSKHTRHAHAFIVDHKVRPESTEEAEWVAEQCRAMFGMQASILTLEWPTGFDPLDHKRFETDARKLRYQALGRACRAADIRELLVAHHVDDQAETVLMRIANERLRSGLQAMQPIERIPECYGMHGVCNSGSAKRMSPASPFPFEGGGVRILRPLLSFDKSRLVATCEHHGVAWAEDKTNHVQTYTSRNAIRHILKNHNLPAALHVEELVKVSKNMQERVRWHKSQARELLIDCPMKLNMQVGTLLIQFPSFHDLLSPHIACSSSDKPLMSGGLGEKPVETWTRSDWNKARDTAACLLAQAGHLVSPRDDPPLGELASAVPNIWPEFRKFEESEIPRVDTSGGNTSYCVQGIWWRKRNSSALESSSKSTRSEWFLMRQPLEAHRPVASHVLPSTQVPLREPLSRETSEWQLFDGRWWINIRNFSADDLILRHFTKADLNRMVPLSISKRGGPERFIAAALSLLKPADIRYTLPAVFQRDSVTKKETLVGLPMLDVSVGTLGSPKNICAWRVHYKKPDNEFYAAPVITQNNSLEFDSGITHAMIEDELAKFSKRRRKDPSRVDK
ncbi:hypothetical protein OPT61_g6454 [Boeremia exigua]|uniref:Uncharacterized protein n=1 Tax=Boeremia exigua TaxID=749465 RepID=A0ACC2I6J7_9PLEO|nr:hypothetical protein OPT61_g6454 [Boeremia exigua]